MPNSISAVAMRAACIVTLAVAACPTSPSWAQSRPDVLPDPDAVIVEELVVTAREPGPAWWRVSNGTSTVYVLGVPATTPKSLTWDDTLLRKRLAGANEVIFPFSSIGVSYFGLPLLALNAMRIKSFTPYEETLPADLKQRFVDARTKAGQPAKRYAYNNGLAAGLYLASDYRRSVGLVSNGASPKVIALATEAKLKLVGKHYDATSLIGAFGQTPKALQDACVEEAIKGVEAGPSLDERASEAWAAGDVRTALLGQRSYERCFAAAPGAGNLDARMKTDEADAIAKALETPGHAVALVQLRSLLASGGVLDKLRARGFSVKTPGEE